MLNKLEQSGTFSQDEEEIIKDVGAVAFEGLPALRCSSRNRTSVTDTSFIRPGGTDTVRRAHRTYLVDSSPHVFRTKVSATLEGLFLALSLHPEVLRKAHSELDEVVGPDRMPTLIHLQADKAFHAVPHDVGTVERVPADALARPTSSGCIYTASITARQATKAPSTISKSNHSTLKYPSKNVHLVKR